MRNRVAVLLSLSLAACATGEAPRELGRLDLREDTPGADVRRSPSGTIKVWLDVGRDRVRIDLHAQAALGAGRSALTGAESSEETCAICVQLETGRHEDATRSYVLVEDYLFARRGELVVAEVGEHLVARLADVDFASNDGARGAHLESLVIDREL